MKRAGRVGDSPILGAGTYADDDLGACSATGRGESAMRVCLAKTAVDLLRSRVHPEEAACAAIRSMTERVGGHGGLILVDRFGRLGLARNTASMLWAAAAQSLEGEIVGA
jgi:beta-aspartyl-peptidase (threonine type)